MGRWDRFRSIIKQAIFPGKRRKEEENDSELNLRLASDSGSVVSFPRQDRKSKRIVNKQIRDFLEAGGVRLEEVPQDERDLASRWTEFSEFFNTAVLGLDTDEYRRLFWSEFHSKGHTIGHVPRTLDTLFAGQPYALAIRKRFWIAVFKCTSFAPWVAVQFLVEAIGKIRRSSYYPAERTRRCHLREERWAITVRRTTNPKPSLQSIRETYAEMRKLGRRGGRRFVDLAMRLGALLEDLERYVDNHLLVKPGVSGTFGRAGGIKRLLEREAPDLFKHYAAIMYYKARMKEYRHACGVRGDPIPPDALLPAEEESGETQEVGGFTFPRRPHLETVASLSAHMRDHGNTDYLRHQDWVRCPEGSYTEEHVLKKDALASASEILRAVDGSFLSLLAAIAVRVDPDCIPKESHSDAVRQDQGPKKAVGTFRTPQRVRKWLARSTA